MSTRISISQQIRNFIAIFIGIFLIHLIISVTHSSGTLILLYITTSIYFGQFLLYRSATVSATETGIIISVEVLFGIPLFKIKYDYSRVNYLHYEPKRPHLFRDWVREFIFPSIGGKFHINYDEGEQRTFEYKGSEHSMNQLIAKVNALLTQIRDVPQPLQNNKPNNI